MQESIFRSCSVLNGRVQRVMLSWTNTHGSPLTKFYSGGERLKLSSGSRWMAGPPSSTVAVPLRSLLGKRLAENTATRRYKHPRASTVFTWMRALAINSLSARSATEGGGMSRGATNSPHENPSCSRQSSKASAEVTHCYARGTLAFLIKWNCIGTRRAFKPRFQPHPHIGAPTPHPVPPLPPPSSHLPLSSGQEWCNSCNFMIHWMQLLDPSVHRASFVCGICMMCAESAPPPTVPLFTCAVSQPHRVLMCGYVINFHCTFKKILDLPWNLTC